MSGTCGVCDIMCESDNSIKCADCEVQFHMKCVNVDSDSIKTRTGKEKKWFCDNCKKGKASSVNSDKAGSSKAITKEFLVSVVEALKQEMIGEMRAQEKRFTELSARMDTLNTAFENVNKNMDGITKQFTEIRAENDELRRTNVTITKQVRDLRVRLRQMEQYSRKCNIEVTGIPETRGEDIQTVIRDIGKAIGMAVEPTDVMAAHRVPSYKAGKTPAIVVQLSSRLLRDTWLEKCKTARKNNSQLTAKQVNSKFPSHYVFINEHLTPEIKMLLAKTKGQCKQIGYKYTWVKEGKIFVRQDDGKKCIRIDDDEDLVNIK